MLSTQLSRWRGGRGSVHDESLVCCGCMELTVLYRPVGQREYELIEASGFRRFPARLPEQPFFYPVTDEEYATQIARDWNTTDAVSGLRWLCAAIPCALEVSR